MNKEQELVNLYCKLIELNPEQVEKYLIDLKIEEIDSDTIVHVLNALSPKSNKIKIWDEFITHAKNRLRDLEGHAAANDLMKVIRPPKKQ